MRLDESQPEKSIPGNILLRQTSRTGFSLSPSRRARKLEIRQAQAYPAKTNSRVRHGSHTRNSDRREIDTNRFSGPMGLLDASPDGWAGQIIPGEKQSGHSRSERFERFDVLKVTQIVLRQGARVAMQVCRYRLSGDAQDTRDFA